MPVTLSVAEHGILSLCMGLGLCRVGLCRVPWCFQTNASVSFGSAETSYLQERLATTCHDIPFFHAALLDVPQAQ